MLEQNAITQFRTQLRGALITPNDPAYEAERKVHNAMIHRKPALIAKCADAADVQTAVRFGRENHLRVSVRCGGHNAGGLGVCDDGLVIDLSRIRYVHVDPSERTVRAGGGSLWGDVDHATHAFGLAVPSGIISTTGVGGLTLGGGLGHLTRKFGLTIDNLLSADLVLADGTFVVASADENSDLFWAIRGGGGNFGVVTSFLFQAHEVHTVCAGPMLWPLDDAADILRWYREFIVAAPEDIGGFFAFLTVPPAPPFPEALHMKRMCGIVWCCTESMAHANELLEPVRSYRRPAFEHVGPVPFPMLQGLFDALYPAGLQMYWKAEFFKEITDDAIEAHVKHGSKVPTIQSTMHLYPINGAASKRSNSDTAWSHRDAVWSGVVLGADADQANRDLITNWARDYWEALHPFGAGGGYVNFMMAEGDDRVRVTYGENYNRLAAIKAKYDPDNFFNVNQNIPPARAVSEAV
jgi:FAD/FMN-containing dehydrogenase